MVTGLRLGRLVAVVPYMRLAVKLTLKPIAPVTTGAVNTMFTVAPAATSVTGDRLLKTPPVS